MTQVVNALYELAGELCEIEIEMQEHWTFALLQERHDILKRIVNLARRECEIRSATSATGRRCFAMYAGD